MKDNNSKQVLLSVLGVAILVVAVVGVSFAAFSYSQTGSAVNTITTGTISLTYNNPTNGINLTNALPMTDAIGKALSDEDQYFDFTVSATISGTATINYAITATKESDSNIPDTGVKVYLTDNASDEVAVNGYETPKKVSALAKTSSDVSGAPDDQYILHSGTFSATATNQYRLRMWVADDYAAPSESQTYKLRVNVYGTAAAQ